ncbi:MAG: hypothetical protein WC777_00600 [Candidatus Gracilibacteria bacterium]
MDAHGAGLDDIRRRPKQALFKEHKMCRKVLHGDVLNNGFVLFLREALKEWHGLEDLKNEIHEGAFSRDSIL